jgi:MFS family permease
MALGYFGVAALVAPAIGPILGGWLVDQGLWRVIFFINPPIGAIGILLGLRFLRDHKSAHKPPFDWLGIVTECIGFGAILYAASIAAHQGWTAPQTLLWFGIFLNASLLGYVSTVALFGAEFLMPVYLQALRGRSALDTGLILLPMALTGGIFVTLSGRLYDRVGPRPLMAVGFTTLVVNTWQLSLLQADTPIGWILFLLALRGLALGLTVQTTMVTALSVVPRPDLARGSSLTNATRLVVQSIGVAVLATVLASTVSPQVKQMQDRFAGPPASRSGERAASAGLCEPVAIAHVAPAWQPVRARPHSLTFAVSAPLPAFRPAPRPSGQEGPLPPEVDALRQQACRENIAGFELAYRITFYAAFVALALGLMLPGWPMKWAGRQMADEPGISH